MRSASAVGRERHARRRRPRAVRADAANVPSSDSGDARAADARAPRLIGERAASRLRTNRERASSRPQPRLVVARARGARGRVRQERVDLSNVGLSRGATPLPARTRRRAPTAGSSAPTARPGAARTAAADADVLVRLRASPAAGRGTRDSPPRPERSGSGGVGCRQRRTSQRIAYPAINGRGIPSGAREPLAEECRRYPFTPPQRSLQAST